jgi:hypothetical protein
MLQIANAFFKLYVSPGRRPLCCGSRADRPRALDRPSPPHPSPGPKRRPGDYLQPGEDEEAGLKARMDKSLSPDDLMEEAVRHDAGQPVASAS